MEFVFHIIQIKKYILELLLLKVIIKYIIYMIYKEYLENIDDTVKCLASVSTKS
jgi:hypothetical protein